MFFCYHQVSYNAAGVLAHIASDGPEAWNIDSPSRANVLQQMVDAIDRWDMKAERNINYRSFEPILGLLRCYHTPECQLWAIWALANLTNVSVYVCKAPHWINCYSFIALQMHRSIQTNTLHWWLKRTDWNC